jgi:TolB-like protein/Flp pilus assembly protein TadD
VAAPGEDARNGELPDLNVFSGSLLLDGLDNLSDEFDDWLSLERQKLEERIRRRNEASVRSSIENAQPGQQRAEAARKAVLVDPTNEEAVRELMRSLASSGQRAQAVVEYERCRSVLRSRLDLEPAPETQQLFRSLRRATLAEPTLAVDTGGTQQFAQDHKAVCSIPPPDAVAETGSLLGAPSIAVLPFITDGGDAAMVNLAQDLLQSLTLRLTAWRWFGVLAPDISFAHRGLAGDAIGAARSLNVRYVLRSRLRGDAARVRVSVELIDGITGYQIWGTVFERARQSAHSLEDEILAKVGALVDAELQRSERHRAMAKSRDQFDAYDFVQRGYWHYARRNKTDNAEALALFSQALERDPTLAPAATGKAACLFWAGQSRWADDPEQSLHSGLRFAQDAMLADASYPVAHLLLGQSLLFLGEQDAAIEAARRAIGLNASYAGGWAFLGHALTATGKFRAAIRSIRRAFELTSHDSRRFMWLSNLAIAHFHCNEFEQAIRLAQEAVRLQPDHWLSNQVVVIGHAALGRAAEVQQLVARLREEEPSLEADQFANRLPYLREADRTRIVTALRAGGWDN